MTRVPIKYIASAFPAEGVYSRLRIALLLIKFEEQRGLCGLLDMAGYVQFCLSEGLSFEQDVLRDLINPRSEPHTYGYSPWYSFGEEV